MSDRTVRVRVLAEMPGYAAMMRAGAADTEALGVAAVAAGRGVRALGVDAAAARGGLATLGAGAVGATGATREAGLAAIAAGRGVRTVGVEAQAASGAFGRVGAAATAGLGRVRAAAEGALAPVKHLGLLLAGGAIIFGLHDIVHVGNEYTDAMNKFLEVTRASGAQMGAAGREAQALGADMKLPSANAAEAADAMVELAKAGLSAQDAIKAARGTIQLAAAARTDVATAAKIEGDIMDQFSLKSSEATKVADTLANTSNSASGELMDIYYAMKYVGPIAHTMGVSLKDAATAVGLLGKSGIIGETAGTALRSALINMSKPTKQMTEGLKTLGIQAYDSNGQFKGLKYVIDQLGVAQEHLSTKQFTAAAAMAFGKPALAGMVALAHQGGTAFEQFGQQVGRVGGAAALAAAESKGLGGAMRGLGKQLTSAFLQVYLGISPTLEKITRGMTSSVSDAIPYIKRGIRTATDLWDIYGPAIEKKLDAATSKVEASAQRMITPLKAGLTEVAIASVPLAITSFQALDKTVSNTEAALVPLTGGLQDMATSVASNAGAFGTFAGRVQSGISLFGQATSVLRPLGQIVGDLAHAFAGLPGPIQLSVLSMLALRPFRPQIQSMQQSVTRFGRAGINAFRGIGDASLYQRVQAANAGITLGRFGGVMAELEQRSPTIARMGESFRTTSTSIAAAGGRLSGFRSTLRGVTAAVGVGARAGLTGAMRGLWAFLGGPWGVAIGAAMIGLDILAKRQQKAAQAAEEHANRVHALSQALVESNGIIDTNVRAQALQELQTKKVSGTNDDLVVAMRKVGVGSKDLIDAYTGQGTSLDAIRKKLALLVAAHRDDPFGKTTQNAENLLKALDSVSGDYKDATASAKDYADGVKGGASAASDATNPTGRLQAAIKTLADTTSDADTKAQALHQALDLLSGGELDVEAAVAQQNQALLDLNGTYKDGVDSTKGYGKALLQVDGSLNTTSENGQTLWMKLQALNEQTASAAQASYDYARANGTAVVPALQKAEDSMQAAWKAAVTAGEKFGLTADQAKQLAAQMGFIPSSLAITMSTPGLSDTEKQLLYVQGLAGHLPKGTSIKVSALTTEAAKDIEAIGFKVKTLPGGRQMEITAPTDKAAAALDALVARRFPDMIIHVSAATQQAIDDLESLKKRLANVPARHSITVSAPSAQAVKALESIGYKVRTLPNHKITITAPTGSAATQIANLQAQIRKLQSKTITITTNLVTAGRNVGGGRLGPGGGYADGGMVHAAQGLFVPGFRPRVDTVPAMLSEGEGVLVPEAVRKLGALSGLGPAGIIKALNMWGRYGTAMHFADGGVVGAQRYASGGFVYSPADPTTTLGVDAGMDRYTAAVARVNADGKNLAAALADAAKKAEAVRDAERNLSRVRSRHHTAAQLAAAEEKLTKARQASAASARTAAADQRTLNAADSALGVRAGTRAVTSFNLAAYEKQLAAANAASAAWERNLATVGRRAGQDVETILRGMGSDGTALVAALAKASGSQFNQIVAQLRALGPTAKATLQDYTQQLNAANRGSSAFQANLLRLAAMGDQALAAQLAAQGDDAAAAIAAAAVKSPGSAAAANAAAKTNSSLLTSDDLANAVTLLGVLRAHPGAGIAEVLAAGLEWSVVQALAPKIAGEIRATRGSGTFVSQMRSQGVAMARGGILTEPTMVLAGEAGVPEAYIPIDRSVRSLGLLARTAAAMGFHLVPGDRWAGPGASGSGTTTIDRSQTVILQGAQQSLGEQRADLLRHMTVLA